MTREQRYILQVLDQVGCIRLDQLQVLLKAKFSNGNDYGTSIAENAVNQLIHLNVPIRREGSVVIRMGKMVNEKLLHAIDIMYAISPAETPSFRAVEPPLLLRFAIANGGQPYLYAVLDGAILTQNAPPLLPSEYAIVLLSEDTNKPAAPLPDATVYAVLQDDGRICFYDAKEFLDQEVT